MVLEYLKSEPGLPAQEVTQPKIHMTLLKGQKAKIQFGLLLAANVILAAIVYNLYATKENAIGRFFTSREEMITGIFYCPENPCAIVNDEIVHEGDMVGKYRVIKIHKDKVELEKRGECFTSG